MNRISIIKRTRKKYFLKAGILTLCWFLLTFIQVYPNLQATNRHITCQVAPGIPGTHGEEGPIADHASVPDEESAGMNDSISEDFLSVNQPAHGLYELIISVFRKATDSDALISPHLLLFTPPPELNLN